MMTKNEEEGATESKRTRGAKYKTRSWPEGGPEVASRGRPLRILHIGSYTYVAYLTGSIDITTDLMAIFNLSFSAQVF